MCEFKRECIIKNVEWQTENEISLAEEAFLTVDENKFLNCRNILYYSNKCPLKRFKKKQQKVHLIEVRIDAQTIRYSAANDDNAKEQ